MKKIATLLNFSLMSRKKQSTPEPPEEFRPSTTRAVAWWAFFFSFCALALSLFTLLVTYQDGRLIRNFKVLSQETQTLIQKLQPAEEQQARETARISEQIRDKISRIEGMIEQNDPRAGYYLDNLTDDIERLREYASDESSVWFGEVIEQLRAAREQLGENSGEAARWLRRVREAVAAKARQLRPESPTSPGQAAEEPSPETAP